MVYSELPYSGKISFDTYFGGKVVFKGWTFLKCFAMHHVVMQTSFFLFVRFNFLILFFENRKK